jgi:hypothetical protein
MPAMVRRKTVCAAPPFVEGMTPLDNGILAFTADEKEAFLAKEPKAVRRFRPMVTAPRPLVGALIGLN